MALAKRRRSTRRAKQIVATVKAVTGSHLVRSTTPGRITSRTRARQYKFPQLVRGTPGRKVRADQIRAARKRRKDWKKVRRNIHRDYRRIIT